MARPPTAMDVPSCRPARSPRSPIYRQPPPPRRSRWATFRTVLGWMLVALLVAAGSAAGGAYLWFHESVAAVVASTPEVKVAAKRLDIALPGEPATALVIGYDKRAGELNKGAPRVRTRSCSSGPTRRRSPSRCSRSRATSTSRSTARARRPSARGSTAPTPSAARRARWRPSASSPALPINYLITVNFRGFRQLVDAVGGIWMDVDRRYFNDQGGDFGYATINLFPGYQKLGGYQALDYVRYRHTDSDLYRLARQQLFVHAFKNQIKANTGPLDLPSGRQDDHRERRGRPGRQQGARPEDGAIATRCSPTRCRRGTSSSRSSRVSRRPPPSTSSCPRRTSGRRCRSSRTRTSSRRRRRRGSR